MSKKILIVESDAALARTTRAGLEAKGFEVEETTDGKGAAELVRKTRPDLVVLAVDLSAGQNGYIICGKLKKDDELKTIPVVIVGNPDGFAQHKKLKTRADEYVPKPIDQKLLAERIGGLIGMPEPVAAEVVDESLSLSDLVDDGEDSRTSEEAAPEEPAPEVSGGTVKGDADLDMLDAAFDDLSAKPKAAKAETPPPPDDPDAISAEEEISLSNVIEETSLSAENEAEDALNALSDAPPVPARAKAAPALAPEPKPVPTMERRASGSMPAADAAELRDLRAKVKEAEAARADAVAKSDELEARVQELEADVASKSADLEAVKSSSGGKHDKDLFAAKEAGTKKDKEILRLKSELNQKDNEIVELQEKQNQLEQQSSESSGEMARRDAQVKTLTTKSEQLTAERKKVDQQLVTAKEEARTASAKLSELQTDFDQLQERLTAAEADLETKVKASQDELDALKQTATGQADELASAKRETDEVRSQVETLQAEADAAKNQLTTQATAFADETAALRKKIADFEESAVKHEERVTKLYARIKGDEKVREKTKKALSIALQLLDEQPGAIDAADEEAAA